MLPQNLARAVGSCKASAKGLSNESAQASIDQPEKIPPYLDAGKEGAKIVTDGERAKLDGRTGRDHRLRLGDLPHLHKPSNAGEEAGRVCRRADERTPFCATAAKIRRDRARTLLSAEWTASLKLRAPAWGRQGLSSSWLPRPNRLKPVRRTRHRRAPCFAFVLCLRLRVDPLRRVAERNARIVGSPRLHAVVARESSR
jgi:hypothetical protein